ncbi:MAG: hypothetical protein WCP52_11735 [Bacteroidota bacterium]
MIKYVALLFNTIALLIYQFFFADGISITQKVPSTVKAGGEFTVELVIKRGDTDGFAKLQQDLPDGFTAEEGSTNGSSFTFTNHSVKFIWMALPDDKEMKLSYKVKVDPKIEIGDKTLAGKFAYVVNNVKQQVEITPSIIKVTGTSQPIVNNTPPANTTQVEVDNTMIVSGKYYDDKEAVIADMKINLVNKKGEIVQTTTTDKDGNFVFSKSPKDIEMLVVLEANDTRSISKNSTAQYKDNKGAILETKSLTGNAPAAVVSSETPPTTSGNDQYNLTNSSTETNGLVCVRKTPKTAPAGGSFIVEININKANISGFAKYVEALPVGFTASALDNQEASFAFSEQKVKFVWVSLPTATSFKISYKVSVAAGSTGDQKIDGAFSYIENDETKKYILPISTVALGGEVAKEEPPLAVKEETKVEPEVKTKELSASTIPSPQGDVNYSVQIAALHNAKAPDVIASYYKITEPVKTEMAEGFTKYTVGAHKVYKQAHDARDIIKTKGVSDAWVTAYNKGKRITVQEALMITSQKWYK